MMKNTILKRPASTFIFKKMGIIQLDFYEELDLLGFW